MDLISVVIPVYNVEKYLRECVESVLRQTYATLEILLIDDGSTDGSGALCDALAKTDSRIRVIHQENRGVSAARNLGIAEATGKYLTFVDSDDLLHPRCLELLRQEKQENSYSCCSWYSFEDSDSVSPEEIPVSSGKRVYSSREALALLNDIRADWMGILVTPWAKLFDRETLPHDLFPLNVRNEDEFAVHHLMAGVERIVLLDRPMYLYRQHSGSYMHSQDRGARNRFVYLEALTERAAFLEASYPELVSGTVHRLLFTANSYYADYIGKPGNESAEVRKYLVGAYRTVYRRHFRLLSAGEKLKGGLYICLPGCYHYLAGVRKKH